MQSEENCQRPRLACDGCQKDITSEDEEEEPSIARDGVRFCPLCWDERVCHRCLHYEEPQWFGRANYCCERCKRGIQLECCTAIAWCQCADVICRDCVRTGDSCCARCERALEPNQAAYPHVADGGDGGLLCARCALAAKGDH
jgi:hypothetical protein